jgi:hypothetical protein
VKTCIPHLLLCILAMIAAGCRTSDRSARPQTSSSSSTRDDADAYRGAVSTNTAITVGGLASSTIPANGPNVAQITVCDAASQWDAPSGGASDGYFLITDVAIRPAQLRICSYAIMNGASAQDLAFYLATGQAVSSSGNVCAFTSSVAKPGLAAIQTVPPPFMTYHLGPYETISRGSGLGVLFSLPANSGICVHRLGSGANPVGIEVTYAAY